MLYPIIFMLFVLPGLIIIEGYQRLSAFMARRGWHWDTLYVLIIILSFLAIALFFFSH